MKPKRNGARPEVTQKEFIKAWQESSSVREVAAKVGRKKNACRVRAFRYRQRGVPLKRFPYIAIKPPDWSELAEFAKSLLRMEDYAKSLLPEGEAVGGQSQEAQPE